MTEVSNVSAEWVELVLSEVIALALVAFGAFYLVREHIQRRRSDGYCHLPAADRRHFRRQYVRRLLGSTLLIAAGSAIAVGQGVLNWRDSPRLYAWLWIGVMLGLLGLLSLAAADLLAIRGYARRHRQRLEQDRREMIERQLAQLRAPDARGLRELPDHDPELN